MLETLKFVQSAVARKDLTEGMKFTHFRIAGGTILGYNGALAICNPIEFNLECCPKASEFTKAIQACTETTQFQLLKNNKLLVRSGAFSAHVPCLTEPFPPIAPEGDLVAIDGDAFLATLRDLQPFIGVDASRPWARGVLFRDGSAFVTNNIVLIQRWIGVTLPQINIPEEAVKALLRLDDVPTGLQVTPTSITVHYLGGRWLRCQALSLTDWPDLGRILDRPFNAAQPIPLGFFDALESLIPFANEFEHAFIINNRISTACGAEEGASVDVADLPVRACFNIRQLHRLRHLATRIDLAAYADDAPSLFFGDQVRGAIVGIHVPGFSNAKG